MSKDYDEYQDDTERVVIFQGSQVLSESKPSSEYVATGHREDDDATVVMYHRLLPLHPPITRQGIKETGR